MPGTCRAAAYTRRRFNAAVGGVLTVGLGVPGAPGLHASSGQRHWHPVRFGLLGDVPYAPGDERLLRQVMRQAGRETSFLVHVGDIKSGAESCRDELLSQRVALLDASPVPLVLAPGDNEWTDCSRRAAGRYAPTERLAYLRKLLKHYPNGLGRGGSALQRPAPGPANPNLPDGATATEFVRWQAGPCLFVVLNVPGSANGLTPHIPDPENQQRARQNTAWLLDSAALARQRGLAGLVVILHADLRFEQADPGDAQRPVLDRKHPYAWVRALLMRVVARFPGTVLLLNGDRHRFVNDQPFARLAARPLLHQAWGVPARVARSRLSRFTRVQSFGWPFSSHYVVIEIRAINTPGDADPDVSITVATRLLLDEPEN